MILTEAVIAHALAAIPELQIRIVRIRAACLLYTSVGSLKVSVLTKAVAFRELMSTRSTGIR